MAEYIIITVHPAPHQAEDLTVSDALRQVLDLVEIVEQADASEGDDVGIVWRLKRATTNSPVTFQVEATSSDPSVSVAMRAANAKQTFEEGMNSLLKCGLRPNWMDLPALKVVKRVLARNLNGIGHTDIRFEEDATQAGVLISPQLAQQGTLVIEKSILDEELSGPNLARTEYGSAEGNIISATIYHNQPALVLKERLSGDRVTCVLSAGAAGEIGPHHSWAEVWSGRRVLVSGAVHYNGDGRTERIDAETLRIVQEREIPLVEMRALDITGGLNPIAYLDLIREAENGQA